MIGDRLQFAQAGGDVGLGAFEDFLHLPGQAVGLVDAADLRVAIAGAQQAGELAVAVKAFVVHLHHADGVEAGEDVLQARRQRVEVLDVQGGNAVAGGAGAVHGFPDRALGRTPADQQHVALGRTVDLGGRQRGRQRLQLLAALGRHLHVQLRRAGRMAEFVVLQTRRQWDTGRSECGVPGTTRGVTPSGADRS